MKLVEKIKNHPKAVAFSTGVLVMSTYATGAFAADGTIDLTTPMTTGLNNAVTQTISIFSALIPIGLTIFTAKFAWTKGVQFFSRIAKQG